MTSAHGLETALTAAPAIEAEIDTWLVSCYAAPLRYVLGAWDWGHGELAGESGPKPWQRQFLLDLGVHIRERQFNGGDPGAPIKMAVSSGVGIFGRCKMFFTIICICSFSARPYPVMAILT